MNENAEYQDALKRVYYADIAERYEDMCDEILYAIGIAKDSKIDLSLSARNYFSLAFKNVVSKRRNSWRMLNSVKNKHPEDIAIIDEKINIIINEIIKYSDQVLKAIDENMPNGDIKDKSTMVFMYKMQGDYLRYKAEVQMGDEQKKSSKNAHEAYKLAVEACKELPSTDPTKLGLFLNYSVFHYEILNDADTACKLAKDAFENAISDLDQLNETYYKDSTLIMQLLRDNLTLWTTRNDVKKPE